MQQWRQPCTVLKLLAISRSLQAVETRRIFIDSYTLLILVSATPITRFDISVSYSACLAAWAYQGPRSFFSCDTVHADTHLTQALQPQFGHACPCTFMASSISGSLAAALRAKDLSVSQCAFLNAETLWGKLLLLMLSWGDGRNHCTVEAVELDSKALHARFPSRSFASFVELRAMTCEEVLLSLEVVGDRSGPPSCSNSKKRSLQALPLATWLEVRRFLLRDLYLACFWETMVDRWINVQRLDWSKKLLLLSRVCQLPNGKQAGLLEAKK